MSTSQFAVFNTLSEKDFFHFFDQGDVDGQKVVDILKYKRSDVAVAASVPLISISYEPQKMPPKLREHLTKWASALNLVAGFFQDQKKPSFGFLLLILF